MPTVIALLAIWHNLFEKKFPSQQATKMMRKEKTAQKERMKESFQLKMMLMSEEENVAKEFVSRQVGKCHSLIV
jgi:hypothetical protein